MTTAEAIDALLPQTQCGQCGYGGCMPYAEAIAAGQAEINQCPPGGSEGIAALALLLGRVPMPLNPANGVEKPLALAWIDEALCIGCTKCIQACPVDAILGANKLMHTVLAEECTGCELCVAPCPVDCILMLPVASPREPEDRRRRADHARTRFNARNSRLARDAAEHDARLAARTAVAVDTAQPDPVQAALARALAKKRGRGNAGHRRVNAEKRHELFRRLRELNPHPTTELEYSSPFELLIAVVLSAQATDVGVNKATRKLFAAANTPAAMLLLGEERLKRHIATIGLFNSKARHVMAACRSLVEEHGGEVPRTREALEALPGVGRKTANVVLNTAFGEPTIAVDTHIFRVSNRTGLAPGKDPGEVEAALLKRVPAEFRKDAHHWLILHGRYVCKARKPDCPHCAIRDLCAFRGKTKPEEN